MEVYKHAVQSFVDKAFDVVDALSSSPHDLQIRYLLYDVMDVFYYQGVLDESPLTEYSDGLDAMGQDLLYWDALGDILTTPLLIQGECLVTHARAHALTIKDFAVYEQLLRDVTFQKLSPITPVDGGLALTRTFAQTDCRALQSPHLTHRKTPEENDILISLNSLRYHEDYPISIALFRVQQNMYRVLTKISDLNYLSDISWWYNTRMFLSCMAWKYVYMTKKENIFLPLISSLSLDRKHGS